MYLFFEIVGQYFLERTAIVLRLQKIVDYRSYFVNFPFHPQNIWNVQRHNTH